jgi:hypothetical protein
MKNIKTFEELTQNDYRNEDTISKLEVMELIYNTIMDVGEDNFDPYEVEDKILDMESSEITFVYKNVPFKLTIERTDELKECTLPRKNTIKQLKKIAKKSKNKSMNTSGGKNVLSGSIAVNENKT